MGRPADRGPRADGLEAAAQRAVELRRLGAVTDDFGRRLVESVPDELAAVERAVELRRQCATLATVAEVLNREGLPTRRGAVWRAGRAPVVVGRVG